jgi:xanthine/CO dehydrogenase XdhC/CoxF family maturation factor
MDGGRRTGGARDGRQHPALGAAAAGGEDGDQRAWRGRRRGVGRLRGGRGGRGALELLRTRGAPRMLHFGIADAEAWDVGLPCGGEIDVFVEEYRP